MPTRRHCISGDSNTRRHKGKLARFLVSHRLELPFEGSQRFLIFQKRLECNHNITAAVDYAHSSSDLGWYDFKKRLSAGVLGTPKVDGEEESHYLVDIHKILCQTKFVISSFDRNDVF
ncbi:hypothetical protein ElyMa_003221500 [Elysia marginata]|uniref:Uncharacterized protein n=1 Tax=Elysia marginata TaxID=1093978 RepID=A0AAV4J5G1_9GAST|nr:hypothetical protein ElyMa_003221500 [Elysia marginata]